MINHHQALLVVNHLFITHLLTIVTYWCVLRRLLDGLLGVAGMIITSDEMDHSRKFPA